MRNNAARFILLIPLAVLIAGTTACVSTSTHKLPLIEGKEVVATVNGDPIIREEYEQEISSLHANMSGEKETLDQLIAGNKAAEKKAGRLDYAGLLKRMIDARLIVQEAKRIGLNELPEVREEVENYSQKAQRTFLMNQVLKDVKPDESMVDELYKKAIHEWKFKSVMFPNEDDAKHMEAEIKAGGNFDNLVSKAVANKKARESMDEGYLIGNELLPQIYDALLTMETGSASPVINVPGGYALVKLEDGRVEESPEKRKSAAEEALRLKKMAVAQTFIESLKKNLVKTDTELLDSLDFETADDPFEKMTKDGRVIAEITGDGQITVSDLAGAVQRKYFHGVERVIGKKGLNAKKIQVMDEMVEKKALGQEARNQGIDKTSAYTVTVKVYENALTFGMFLQKVVLPEIKITEPEIKAYYDGHRSDYTSPERMKLDSVVFKKRSDAEEAMRKLRAGDQLSWIKENATGQVQLDKDDSAVLILDGHDVLSPGMAEGLKSALSGASAGDFRLYESPEGYFYAISVVAVYPSVTQDYAAVRQLIAKQLYNEHVQAAVAGWVEKLRNVAAVNVYLKD
ncbi:MAG: peptidyl-prolyl cis-trans isomerase [Betaproteobacteria bacterium]